MFKRILAFVLASLLVVESAPITGYASSETLETVSGNVETSVSENADSSVSDNVENTISENIETVSENQDKEESADSEIIVPEAGAEESIQENAEEAIDADTVSTYASTDAESLTSLTDSTANILTLTGYDAENGRTYHWYTYKVPEDGYYSFNATNLAKTSSYSCIAVSTECDSNSYFQSVGSNLNAKKSVNSTEVKAGDILYIGAYTMATEGASLSLEIRQIPVYTFIKQADGSYNAETDLFNLNVYVEGGYCHIRSQVSVKEKEGQTLPIHNLYMHYKNDKGSGKTGHYSSSASGYNTKLSLSLSMNKEYEIYYSFEDNSTKEILGYFYLDNKITTKFTEEDVVINEMIVNHSFISLDMEIMQEGNIYYAPTDGSAEEKRINVYSGWNTIILPELLDNTEYNIVILNRDGYPLYQTTATTKTNPIKANYSISVADNFASATLYADVSDYTGNSSYVSLQYEYIDVLGTTKRGSVTENLDAIEADGNGRKSFLVETEILQPLFKADSKYNVTMWLDFSDEKYVRKQVVEFATKDAFVKEDGMTLSVVSNAEINGQADVSVQLTGLPGWVDVALYYKQKDSLDAYNKYGSVTVVNNEITLERQISDLEAGAVYEFVAYAGGMTKSITATIGTPTYVLSQVGEGETNAFDIVRTYKLESAEGMSGYYYLNIYCYDGNKYQAWGNTLTLSSGNGYQNTFKSVTLNKILSPDTDYKIKCTVSNGTKIVATLYDTVRTSKADISFTDAGVCHSKKIYDVVLNKDNFSNFPVSSQYYVYLYPYVKKTGENNYRIHGIDLFHPNYDYKASVCIEGLEPATSYDVSMRDEKGCEYAALTFETTADNRQLSIASITPSNHSATINTALAGFGCDYGYIHAYIREKGTGDEWYNAGHRTYEQADINVKLDIIEYYDEILSENTTYEVAIGISPNSYVSSMNNLEMVCTSEFTTLKDNRCVSGMVSPGYKMVQLYARLTGNNENKYTYIHYYVKEKGATEWIYSGYSSTNSTSNTLSKNITDLKTGTNYEYEMVINDSYSKPKQEDIEAGNYKAVGEFTTKSNTYTFDFALNNEKTTYNRAILKVAAKGGYGESNIDVTFTLSNGQEQTVTLKNSENYKNEVIFEDLLGDTEYTVTKAVINVKENNSIVTIGEVDCGYRFITKIAEVPTEILLVDDTIGLNAIYSDFLDSSQEIEMYDLEELGCKKIKAEVMPQTAADNFVYSSSNESVATVDAQGFVYAKAPGIAEITVTSYYDENVKATCKVEVKRYKVGQITENGVVEYPGIFGRYSLDKGETRDGLGLYEIADDGTGTLVSDFTAYAEKESVAVWKDNQIYAVNPGSTSIIFEKDDVKARYSISVYSVAKGFGITGFDTSDDYYPALENEDGSYTLANISGITYKAIGEIMPAEQYNFNSSYFTWKSSNETVATVSSAGVITPIKDGTVTLTVTSNNDNYNFTKDKVEIVLHIKGLPMEGTYETIYALANQYSSIGEVPFPENWGEGWRWKYPDTPLVTNGVYNDNNYYFEAVYDGNNGYPIETELQVYIGKITGVVVREIDNTHNNVVEVNDTDSIRVTVNPLFQGFVQSTDYTVEIPSVKGLNITKANGFYTITAQKKGKFTLQPVIKLGDKIVAKTKYVIKAVTDKQAVDITLASETDGVTIEGNKITFDSFEKSKEFVVKATVKDRQGEEISTKLQWKTSDNKVASVKPDKKNTQIVKVSSKEAGHATIIIKAKDTLGYQIELAVEIQDHAPRVDTNKATVNIAYNYNEYYGLSNASKEGTVDIVPVYGEFIRDVMLFDKEGKEAESNLTVSLYDNKYYIKPAKENIPTGKYSCILRVKTSAERVYEYPMTVTVVNKKPSVSLKATNSVNLFYTTATGQLNLKTSNNAAVDAVVWEDKSEAINNGFEIRGYYTYSSNGKYLNYITVSQSANLAVVKGTLKDPSVAEGTLTVRLRGYRDEYVFNNVKIKYNYKKPVLVTKYDNNNIVPIIGQNENNFLLYNKTDKTNVYYNSSRAESGFDEIVCDEMDIELRPKGESSCMVYYRYLGNASQKKFVFNVEYNKWREAVQVSHTIKTISPKASLKNKQLIFSTYTKDAVTTDICLDKASNIEEFADIVVKGANAKSQKLLDDDLFIARVGKTMVTFVQSDDSLMNSKIPKGSYNYKLTPYVKNAKTGEKIALNTLSLTIKVVDKPATAKVSPKGTIDLATGYRYCYVYVEPQFSNITSGYTIQSAKLVGGYSGYFALFYSGGKDYIQVNPDAVGKLKAGQNYKLAIEYTISTNAGDIFTVTSNTFNIKPKQSKAKIKVENNNQTLYVGAADKIERKYRLVIPSSYYIDSAYGSVDCNKDGQPDIVAEGTYDLKVKITDKNGVIATKSGKSYTIPVTVKLVGRDGIAKDTVINLKVKVKR